MWAGHLAAVANEGAVYRRAVGPAANGRRRGCGGSLFELAAAADGGWRRVAPAVRGHRGRGVWAARSGAGVGHLWGLRASELLRGSSGRWPSSLGRAEPRARRHLPARGAGGCGRPSSCPVLSFPVLSCPRSPPCRGLGNLPGWFLGREMGNVGGVYCHFLALTNIFWFVGVLCPSGFPQMVGRSFLSVMLCGY